MLLAIFEASIWIVRELKAVSFVSRIGFNYFIDVSEQPQKHALRSNGLENGPPNSLGNQPPNLVLLLRPLSGNNGQ